MMSMLLSLTACEPALNEDPQDDPNEDPQEVYEYPTISLLEVSEDNITIDAKINEYEGTYYVGVITNADFAKIYESDSQAYAEKILVIEKDNFNTDLGQVDNTYIYDDSAEISLNEAYNLVPNTEYEIIVFGINADAEVLTEPCVLEAKTEAIEIAGEIGIEVKELTTNKIVVAATPSSEVVNYTVVPITVEKFETMYESDPALVAKAIFLTYSENDIDVKKVDNRYIFSGAQDIDISKGWNIFPETDYLIFAFGITEKGFLSTEVKSTPCSTPAGVMVDASLTIEVKDVTTSKIFVDVDVTGEIGTYYLALLNKAAFVETYNSDANALAEGFMSTEINLYQTDLSVVDSKFVFDANTENFDMSEPWQITADTEYVIIAFGMDATGFVTTEVATAEAKTKALGGAGKIELTLAEATAWSVVVHAKPDASIGNYIGAMLPKSDYVDSFGASPDAIAQMTVMFYPDFGADYAVADGMLVYNGEMDINMSDIWGTSPDSEQIVCMFGVDEAGEVTSEISILEVKCPAEAAASAVATSQSPFMSRTLENMIKGRKSTELLMKSTIKMVNADALSIR